MAKKQIIEFDPDTQDAVIYTRYSSHNQRDCSIEQQVADCEIFARQNNLRVVKVYADRHLSGTTDNRPQFQQMLKDAAHGHWAYVICWKIDRFARNRYDSATYKFRLKKAGVRVLYAKESIPDGPEGILLESVLEGSAEYYSAALAQNIRRGMKYNAEQCKVNSGSIPFGYRKGPDGRFAIHEANAEVVREIFRKAAAGMSFVDIANDLNSQGRAVEQGQLPAVDERGLYRGVSFLGHPHRGRDARSHRSGHLLGGERASESKQQRPGPSPRRRGLPADREAEVRPLRVLHDRLLRHREERRTALLLRLPKAAAGAGLQKGQRAPRVD